MECDDSGHSLLLNALVLRYFPPSSPHIPNSKKRMCTKVASIEDTFFVTRGSIHISDLSVAEE